MPSRVIRPLLQTLCVLLPLLLLTVRGCSWERRPLRAMRLDVEQRRSREALLAQRQADLVVIGNSVVATNLLQDDLQRQLGVRTALVAEIATGISWTFLAYKNLVLKAEHRPKLVAIFFRDWDLVRTSFRANSGRLGQVAEDDEPEFERLVQLSGSHPVLFFLHEHVDLFRERSDSAERFNRMVQQSLAAPLLNVEPSAIREASGRVFADERRDAELLAVAQANAERLTSDEQSFELQVERSFLPTMLALARQRDLRLAFVRAKRERHARGQADSEQLGTFLQHLRQYLTHEGAELHDMTASPLIKAQDFTVHDHVRATARARYTRAVAQTLRPSLASSR